MVGTFALAGIAFGAAVAVGLVIIVAGLWKWLDSRKVWVEVRRRPQVLIQRARIKEGREARVKDTNGDKVTVILPEGFAEQSTGWRAGPWYTVDGATMKCVRPIMREKAPDDEWPFDPMSGYAFSEFFDAKHTVEWNKASRDKFSGLYQYVPMMMLATMGMVGFIIWRLYG